MTEFVGRVQERQLLRAALVDRGPRLLVVRGPSGVGKTALIEQALRDVASTEPILGRGKYAEQATSTGLRPVVEALSQAVDAALGRLYDPVAGAASLRGLVGPQYDTLLAAGFSTAGLAAPAAPSFASALRSREGTIRLVDALMRVLQWLEGFALPLVLFVDDWHRAPNEAVGFVHACASRGDASTLKLILSARGEAAAAYPGAASIVELDRLADADQADLLVDILGEVDKARAVLDWLGSQASGFPFDLAQIALALQREHAFVHDGTALRVDPARAAAIDHRDIDRIIAQRARTLPPAVLRLGIAAALWGDRAPLDTLGGCLVLSPAATRAAAEDLQTNGLLRLDGDEVSFPHDRIRASLLQLPDDAERRAFAHGMSARLLGDGPVLHRQTALRLKLVGGIEDVRDAWLAGLFATEAASARLAAQFDLAADFAEAAWSISQHTPGVETGHRLKVLREACFVAAHRRQAEETRERCRLMIAAATDAAELADAYERTVIAMRLAGTASDAWSFAREGYARFGIHVPDRVGTLRLALAALVWKLVGRKPRRLIRHDERTEQAVSSFANAAAYSLWERGPRLAAYVAIQVATRARLMGYDSARWLGVDTMISSVRKDYRAAAALGDRTMAGLPQLTSGQGMTIHRAVVFGKMWRGPRASLVDSTHQVYDFCIAEGDLVGAANAVRNDALWTWRSAATLEEIAAKLAETLGKAERLGALAMRAEIARLAELVRRLRAPTPPSAVLPDEFVHSSNGVMPMIAVEYLSAVEDWPAVLRVADEYRGHRDTIDYHPVGAIRRFYENLARLRTGLPASRSDMAFLKRAAAMNPTDQLGRLLLLQAERRYRRGKKDCLRLYARAIEAMQKGSSRLELGLAAECAAEAARDLGDRAAHERFRATAAATWSDWGAFAKLAAYQAAPLDASIRARLAEAEAQTAMAQRGERAKSRFLAEIGHELRTPLQAMQGLLDLAAERPGEVDVGEIREVFGSLKSVVDDLTELGALGAEAPLNTRTSDLAALLGSELALVQEAARGKGLALASDLAALRGRGFDIDPDRVRQAVRNLLSNALKYTDRGAVALRASVSEGLGDQALLVLAVEDTGPGIPQERLALLFEPFDRAGRRDSKGLGLGLSLSRRIAERMGGSLTVENRAEGGARFVFSFSAVERDAPSPRLLVPAVPRSLTILIVEDTDLVRRLMARLLAHDGHQVIEAEDIAQGVEQARRHRLDLLLLDLQLPDGDGLSLLERWPAERERPPVIVLTAAVARETGDRLKGTGGIVLRKPIAAADLRAAIARACGAVEVAKPSNGFDAEMAKLAQEARGEIAERAAELIALVTAKGSRTAIQQRAHKLAGLAAQFDAPRIATAADGIERGCVTGLALEDLLPGLAQEE